MTTATATALPRLFKLSSLELADPAPELPPEEAIKLYAGSYPQLNVAELSEPEFTDTHVIYHVEKNEVKTKG